MQSSNGVYTVGDFMTRKEELHVVKPTTTVEEGNWNFWIFSPNPVENVAYYLCL